MNEFKKRLRDVKEILFSNELGSFLIVASFVLLLVWLSETFKLISLFFSALFILFVLFVFFYVIYNVLKFIYWLFIEPFIKK